MSIENIVREVRAEIGRLQQVLALLGPGTVQVQKASHVATNAGKPRRKMSAAGRRRIGAAARARWAKIREAKTAGKVSGNIGVKPRRKMSAAGRKKIAAAQRARWAKVRAEKKAG